MTPVSLIPRQLLFVLHWVVLSLTVAATGSGIDEALPGTASDEHLWFVLQDPAGGETARLHQHARNLDGPYDQMMLQLPRAPLAMAAWGNQLWLVYPPRLTADSRQPGQREVYTVQLGQNPVTGRYYTIPRDRLEVVAPLPGRGKLAGLVGAPGGPLALLTPPQRADSGVEASEDSAAAEPVLEEPVLLQLQSVRWTPIELPKGFDGSGRCHLTAAGENGEQLVILAASSPSSRRRPDETVEVHWRDGAGRWTSSEATLPSGRLRSLARAGGQTVAVMTSLDGERCGLFYLRPTRFLALAEFGMPQVPWSVFGLAGELRIVAGRAQGRMTMRSIERITGRLGDVEQIQPPPVDMMYLLRLPALLAVAAITLALAALYRPGSRPAISLPAGLGVAPPSMRITALLIDMLPAGLISLWILRCSPGDLIGMPLMTATFEQSMPYSLMALLTILHSAVTELVAGRSLGKIVVGSRVIMVDGGKPGRARMLLRNLMKAFVVLFPPLAVFTLANPNLQGLEDLSARTIVVCRKSTPSLEPSKDR